MNNKGAIFSGFMYVLLMFFLLSLATLLSVLNNSKKISNKAREGAENIINNETSEFSFDLKGITNVCMNLGETYTDDGREVEAVDVAGNPITISVSSDFVQNQVGTFTVTYTAKDKGKEKSVERKVHVLKNDYSFNTKCNINEATPAEISECIEEQKIVPLCDGYYSVELWGAKHASGTGGYTKGVIKLTTKDQLYLYIGQSNSVFNNKSFNGGTGTNGGYPGAGATDLRLLKHKVNWFDLDSLKSRIMVAGGAGTGNISPSHGGGLVGLKTGIATAGTQTSPGVSQGTNPSASFGIGGGGFGGGGGYYGAGGADNAAAGGAGGSGFISGLAGSNAITNDLSLTHTNNTLHYSKKYFVNNIIETGAANDAPNGNGKAKITYIGVDYPKTNAKFNGVRYVRDCANGSGVNGDTHWIELQVIKDGVNLALGKEPVGTSPFHGGAYPYSIATDGIMDDVTKYSSTNSVSYPGVQCITIDLGKVYDVDEIAVWHYYGDGRTYNDTATYVSSDNTNWDEPIMSFLGAETVNGNRANAWN